MSSQKCKICRKPGIRYSQAMSSSEKESTLIARCFICRAWWHIICDGKEPWSVYYDEEYRCSRCAQEHGQAKRKAVIAAHRLKAFELDVNHLPIEIGSSLWVANFAKVEKKIKNSGRWNTDYRIIECKNGFEFADSFQKEIEATGEFKHLYLIRNSAGLNLRMPDKKLLNEQSILDMFGEQFRVEAIDVQRQIPVSVSLKKFFELCEMAPEERFTRLNILSFEFSRNERMTSLVQLPEVVRRMSWERLLWKNGKLAPWLIHALDDEALKIVMGVKPFVELYLLLGMMMSYTDFHCDFGGSAVYYHVIKGKKIFYVVPPTEENLQEYMKWNVADNSSEIFFGDIPSIKKSIRRVEVTEGETLMMPGGWIHAVLTCEDSIVIGGNYLCCYNIQKQLRIRQLELQMKKVLRMDARFEYPNFEIVHWLAARAFLLTMLKSINMGNRIAANGLWQAIELLFAELHNWHANHTLKMPVFRNRSFRDYQETVMRDLSETMTEQEEIRQNTLCHESTEEEKESEISIKEKMSPTSCHL